MKFEPVAPVSDLIMRHAGKSICIMGGSPSLADDLSKVKADVYISVNGHGAKLHEPDYIVCMDNTHTGNKRWMRDHLKDISNAPVISPWHWGAYQIGLWPDYPYLFNSGVIASWVAYLMGAHPIIFAGFDCYGGQARIIDMHRKFVKHNRCENRVVSGCLQKLYKAYNSDEIMQEYVKPSIFGEALDGQIKVKVLAQFEYRGYQWPIGSILTVGVHEVKLQLKHKSLERVDDGKA